MTVSGREAMANKDVLTHSVAMVPQDEMNLAKCKIRMSDVRIKRTSTTS